MIDFIKNKKKILCGGILAGTMIGIACGLFLSVADKTAGALMFSVALYVIIDQKLQLFTGKAGDFLKGAYSVSDMFCMLCVNLAAAALAGFFISFVTPQVTQNATALIEYKAGIPILDLIIKGFFCGILMAFAVEGHKNGHWWITGLCIGTFILCGFEHCIALAGYCGMVEVSLSMIGKLFILAAANFLGSAQTYYLIEEMNNGN